ncbi:MAG: shikimate kinase [Acidobacteriota bacterium]|jgi:shikimate kinase
MNLVLIGYRGTGKSTIGRRLSEVLRMPYICFDEEIVRRAGMTIPEIVERYSWDRFRELESRVVSDYAARDGQILDTGGGVVTRPENVAALRENSILVLLEAKVEDIVSRIGSTTDRPSLSGDQSFVEEVEDVLKERRPLYEAAADHRVDTSLLSQEEAVQAIVQIFRRVR